MKGWIDLDIGLEFLFDEGGETFVQVAQGSCDSPIIGSVQDQVRGALSNLGW